LSEAQAFSYYYQIVNAIDFVHEMDIVHGGVSLENIYLTERHILKLGHIRQA
jgi:serine/threonine protein kinase